MKNSYLNQRWIQILAVGVLLALLTGLFAACGQTQEQPGTNTETAPDTKNETPAESQKETEADVDFVEKQTAVTDYLTLYGRTTVKENKLRLFWTNSGFSMKFKGTGVSANIAPTTQNKSYYGFLKVYIDGAFEPSATICVNKTGTYALAEGLDDGVHTLEVRKRNEAAYGESASLLISNIKVQNGGFITEPPEAKPFHMEVIGDSITCGFGNMISDGKKNNFSTDTEDGTMTYAVLAAKALNAEVSIIARSGIGYLQGATCDSMYPVYTKAQALPRQSLSDDAWDFSAHPMDVVVINLGTNDNGATMNGQRISTETYTDQAVEFIKLVRENNPNAVIIWAYGMMGTGVEPALKAAVAKAKADGVDDVYYLRLNPLNSNQDGIGVAGHPTIQTDIERSVVLAQTISDLTGQDVDYSVPLKAQIQYAKEYWLADTTGYTEESVNALRDKIREAETATVSSASEAEALRAALRETYEALSTGDDMSNEYIVIEECTTLQGWQSGGMNKGVDDEDWISSGASFTTEGSATQNNIYFIRQNGYSVEMPENWEDWYLEMWMYLDDPSVVNGGSCIEISQDIDKIEFAWDISSLGLKPGWNHLQLKISGAAKTNPEQFKTIKNLRFFLFLSGETTFKIDDIVLSKGRYAADKTELQELLKKAGQDASQSSAQKEAVQFANKATSQRSVDLAAEKLSELFA